MRHRAYATAILLLALVGSLVLGAALAPAGAHRQGTPEPAPGAGSGVTTEVLGHLEPAQAPGQALHLLRVTFAPGGAVAAHVHPGATIYHLAAGSLQFTLLEGEARLVRAENDAPAAGTSAATEPVPAGEEITLGAGDTVYYDGAAVQAERNDGDVPAVVLVSNLRGIDEPAREFVEGTPGA
jgi:quercetin dioxygenase-like cupin family protein